MAAKNALGHPMKVEVYLDRNHRHVHPKDPEAALHKLSISAGHNIDAVLSCYAKAMQNMLNRPDDIWAWRLTPRNAIHRENLLKYPGAGELLEAAGFERKPDHSFELIQGPDVRFFAVRSAAKRRLAAYRRRQVKERQEEECRLTSTVGTVDRTQTFDHTTTDDIFNMVARNDQSHLKGLAATHPSSASHCHIQSRGHYRLRGTSIADRARRQQSLDYGNNGPLTGAYKAINMFSTDGHPVLTSIKEARGGLEALQAVEDVLLKIRNDPNCESIRCVNLNSTIGKKLRVAMPLLHMAGFEEGKLITSSSGHEAPYVILSQLKVDCMERVWAMLWWTLHQDNSRPDPFKELAILDHAMQHILGAMLGAVIGDALGAPLGIRAPSEITFDEIDKVFEMCGGGGWQLAPGQATNNSELLVCLTSALEVHGDSVNFCASKRRTIGVGSIQQPNFPLDVVALMYSRWASSAPFRVDSACRTAFDGLMDGAALTQRAKSLNMKATSNGALVRCLALIALSNARSSPENIAHLARTDASLSHPNPSVAEASATYAVAAADLVTNKGDVEETLDMVFDWAEQGVKQKQSASLASRAKCAAEVAPSENLCAASQAATTPKSPSSARSILKWYQSRGKTTAKESKQEQGGGQPVLPSESSGSSDSPNNSTQFSLDITISSARGLHAADPCGTSDPYCVFQVVGKPFTKQHTPVIRRTLCPQWNEQLHPVVVDNRDVLEFAIFDNERYTADEFLGKCCIGGNQILPHGFKGELALTDTKGSEAFLCVSVQLTPGLLNLSLWSLGLKTHPSLPPPKLRVTIVRARGLRKADVLGKADPYCVFEIPGKPQSKFQTRVIKQALEPNWCHVCEEVTDWSPFDTLHFSLYDADRFTTDDFLGKATLSGPQVYPNGFDGDVRLMDAGKGNPAVLNVRCEVLEEEVMNWLIMALHGDVCEELPFSDNLGAANSVQVAFCQAFRQLRRCRSFPEAMRAVLGGGGDASTNAAAVGGLVGAAVGVNGIPRHWIRAVLSCDSSKNGKQARPCEFLPSRLPSLVHKLYHMFDMRTVARAGTPQAGTLGRQMSVYRPAQFASTAYGQPLNGRSSIGAHAGISTVSGSVLSGVVGYPSQAPRTVTRPGSAVSSVGFADASPKGSSYRGLCSAVSHPVTGLSRLGVMSPSTPINGIVQQQPRATDATSKGLSFPGIVTVTPKNVLGVGGSAGHATPPASLAGTRHAAAFPTPVPVSRFAGSGPGDHLISRAQTSAQPNLGYNPRPTRPPLVPQVAPPQQRDTNEKLGPAAQVPKTQQQLGAQCKPPAAPAARGASENRGAVPSPIPLRRRPCAAPPSPERRQPASTRTPLKQTQSPLLLGRGELATEGCTPVRAPLDFLQTGHPQDAEPCAEVVVPTASLPQDEQPACPAREEVGVAETIRSDAVPAPLRSSGLTWVVEADKHFYVKEDEAAYVSDCLERLDAIIAEEGGLLQYMREDCAQQVALLGTRSEDVSPEQILRNSFEALLQDNARNGGSNIFVEPGRIKSMGMKKIMKLVLRYDEPSLEFPVTVIWDWNVKLECGHALAQ